MKVQAIIDRFEGDLAVLLAGDEEQQVLWPRQLMPADAKEGDLLAILLTVDEHATRMARSEAEAALKRLLSQD